jgi:hypothetical protein
MKKIGMLLLCALAVACMPAPKTSDGVLDVVLREAARDMKQSGFTVPSTRVIYPNTLRQLQCEFYTQQYQLRTTDECRRVYMRAFLDYVQHFNGSKRLRPYLHHYPVTGEMIEIEMDFFDAKGRLLTSPLFARVHNQNGVISYYHWDKQESKYTTQYAEPFDVAMQIYEKELQEAPGAKK